MRCSSTARRGGNWPLGETFTWLAEALPHLYERFTRIPVNARLGATTSGYPQSLERGDRMTILWIILVVVLVLALLGFLGFR
jgi:hypothetical protein